MDDFVNNIKNNRKFREISILGISTIISSGIGGLFWMYLASILGTEEYGKISYLISIGVIASTISLAGMSNTMVIYRAKGIKIQSIAYFIGTTTSVITALVVYFVLKESELSLYVIGYVLFTLITAEVIGQKLFSQYAKFIIIQKCLLVVLAIVFYNLAGLNGIIFGMAISFLPFAYIVIRTFRKEKINFVILKDKRTFIINNYLLDLSNAFNGSLDKIIIAPFLGFGLLGNYALGLQFLALLHIIPGIFYQYILPKDASGDSTTSVKKTMILVSVIISVCTIILSPIIVPKLFPNFTDAIEVIQIMSISIVFYTINSAYVSKYLGLTKNKFVIVGSGIYLTVQIPTLIILGEAWGVNGAAISLVISAIIHAVYFVIIDNVSKSKT